VNLFRTWDCSYGNSEVFNIIERTVAGLIEQANTLSLVLIQPNQNLVSIKSSEVKFAASCVAEG
jgi:hypothetical protein